MENAEQSPAHMVLTGAPASGKSILFDRLKTYPSFSDFIFFDELARLLLKKNPRFRNDMKAFHAEIYKRQVEREDSIENKPFITDRGTIDAFAFHPETIQETGTTIEKEYCRYSAVIQLGTSARLGEKHYQKDDIRLESPEEALAIEDAIKKVWENHPHYYFVEACPDFEDKYLMLLRIIKKITCK